MFYIYWGRLDAVLNISNKVLLTMQEKGILSQCQVKCQVHKD